MPLVAVTGATLPTVVNGPADSALMVKTNLPSTLSLELKLKELNTRSLYLASTPIVVSLDTWRELTKELLLMELSTFRDLTSAVKRRLILRVTLSTVVPSPMVPSIELPALQKKSSTIPLRCTSTLLPNIPLTERPRTSKSTWLWYPLVKLLRPGTLPRRAWQLITPKLTTCSTTLFSVSSSMLPTVKTLMMSSSAKPSWRLPINSSNPSRSVRSLRDTPGVRLKVLKLHSEKSSLES